MSAFFGFYRCLIKGGRRSINAVEDVGLFRVASFFELDAGSLGQQVQGLAEIHVLGFHYEVECPAPLGARAEASPTLALRIHHEGGCLFVVERAVGLKAASRFLESDVGRHHVDDVESGLYVIYYGQSMPLALPDPENTHIG